MMAALLVCHSEERRERKVSRVNHAERWWLAQAPHGCLLDLIHEGDEVLMERAEGIDHEGRESRADVLRVSIVFEVFGSASALDGFARTAGAAEVGPGRGRESGRRTSRR